jgi:hypothetical protein
VGKAGRTILRAVGQYIGWEKAKFLFWFVISLYVVLGTVCFLGDWDFIGDFSDAIWDFNNFGTYHFNAFGMLLILWAITLVGFIRWVYSGNRVKQKWIVYPAIAISILYVLWTVERQIPPFLQRLRENPVSVHKPVPPQQNSVSIHEPVPPPASAPPVSNLPADNIQTARWGMSVEQVKAIESATPSGPHSEPNEVGTDYLIYRNDSAHYTSRRCYYFTDEKLVEIRDDYEEVAYYDDALQGYTKRLGQPVNLDVKLSPVNPDGNWTFEPVKSVTFVSPTDVVILVTYPSGGPVYSDIHLDRSQPQLVAR